MIVEEAGWRHIRPARGVSRSPVLLRLHMLELESGLRTLMLPSEIANEVRDSIGRLRRSILRAPAKSEADQLAKNRTAREAADAGGLHSQPAWPARER